MPNPSANRPYCKWHTFILLWHRTEMQLPRYQNTAISLRKTVQGPLKPWILTHEQNLSKQLFHRAARARPCAQSWQAMGTLTAVTVTLKAMARASQPHRQTHWHFFSCLNAMHFLIHVYTHIWVQGKNRCVVLYPSPSLLATLFCSLLIWLLFNKQMDILH